MTLMKVVYVAGPFRGPSSWDIEQNIRRAESLSLDVWRSGAAALCPHTNTRFFQNAAPDDVWLAGDLAMLAKCDAILMTLDWERSTGARAEHDFAVERLMPVFYTLASLQAWLADMAAAA
jgi:nucleoside 2-deoxyribosyltransferase